MKFSRFVTTTLAIIGTVAVANYAVKAIKKFKEECTDDECCLHNECDNDECNEETHCNCEDKVVPETEIDNDENEFEYTLKEKDETSNDEDK